MKTTFSIIAILLVLIGLYLFIVNQKQKARLDGLDQAEVTNDGDEKMTSETDVTSENIVSIKKQDGTFSQETQTDFVLNTEKTSFMFIGFGPGKSHEGTFDALDATIAIHEDGSFAGSKIVFDMSSVNTGIDGLDKHLQAADFFDVANHPTATFTVNAVSENNINGSLTFNGVTKNLTIPATVTDGNISFNFKLDVSTFGLDIPEVAFDEVEIKGAIVWSQQ